MQSTASVQQCVTAIEQWMAASRLRLNMDKTELIWTGTKHNLSKIPGCGRALTLGAAHVAQSDQRVLGVKLPSDLSLDKYVNVVSQGFDKLVCCVPVASARDLCVVVDSQLTMSANVSSTCRSTYHQLRHLRPVTVVRSLSVDAAKTAVQSFVSTRLDYCNSLMWYC